MKRVIFSPLTLGVALWVAGLCAVEAGMKPTPGKADPTLPFIQVLEAAQAPVIDGKLDDECWKKAEESSPMTDEYHFPVKVKTTFKICQKDEVLYLAINGMYDEKGGKKTGSGSDGKSHHDADLWDGEELEVFIDPDNNDTPGYYQLILTPFDQTGDAYCSLYRDTEWRWEPKYEVKSQWTSNAWTIEYAIPLAAFDRTSAIYENFGLGVHRVDGEYFKIGSWSPGHTEGFHYMHKAGEARGLKGKDVKTNAPGMFRAPILRVNDRVIKAQANPSLIPEKPPALVSGPDVKPAGGGLEIAFEVNTRTDVAVWIEDARGERVRHLVAGMLGPNPPTPLKKDALKQSVNWDYLDDFGKKVPAGTYKVKVGVGSKAGLDRAIGAKFAPQQINGIATDAKGNVLTVGGHADETLEVMRFGKDGKYQAMLYPPPANIPPEKLKGMNIIDFGADGQVRWGSHRIGAFLPSLDTPMPQTPMVNSQGQLIIFGGEYQGGPGRFYKINADGSLPEDFIGPYVKDITWQQYYENWIKRFHFALDPEDENVIYLSGLKEIHRLEGTSENGVELDPKCRETFFNCVSKVRWGTDAAPERVVGKQNLSGTQGSDKPGEFFDPQGIAFDGKSRLWVCDRRNNRIQVFDRSGKFLFAFPHTGPYEVRISRKQDVAYVLGIVPLPDYDTKGHGIVHHLNEVVLTKYSAGEKPKVLATTKLDGFWSYWWDMALDDSGDKPVLWLVWAGDVNQVHGATSATAHSLARVADLGDKFGQPEVLIGKDDPVSYGGLAVSWDTDVVGAGRFWFDGNTGALIGDRSIRGGEFEAGRDGNWYVREGFCDETVSVFPPDWPKNPKAAELRRWPITPGSLNRNGLRGFCVAPNGDVYVARYYQWRDASGARAGMEGPDVHVAVDRFSNDGKVLKQRVIYELSESGCAPVVDIKGNIYVLDNIGRRIGQLYEDDIATNLPTWVPDYKIDWDALRAGKNSQAGYNKFVLDPLIKCIGTLYKFGPEGGGVLWRAAQGPYTQYWPQTNKEGVVVKYSDWGYPAAPIPNRPATHWQATIVDPGREGMWPRWQEGVKWEFLGVGSVWGRYSKGHDACCCKTIRFCVDDFGRSYVPAAHRHTIRMVDTAGNEVLRIGAYGNLDSYGPGSPIPQPEIPVLWPSATALSKRYLYITEERLPRVLRVKMGYAQEKSAEASVK